MIITTTDTLQGVEIVEYIGPVTAMTLINAKDSFRGLDFKGAMKGDSSKMAGIINDAICVDLNRAGEKVGADAVISVRFQNLNNSNGYIYSYGTAVKLKK